MPVGSVQIRVGPLSSTAAGLRGAIAAVTGPIDPAVFLARLMTLRGSIELSQQLEAGDDASVPGGEGHATLRALVAERVGGIRQDVRAMFSAPFQRRNKLLTPEQVWAVLVETGALGGAPGAPSMAADTIWAAPADLLTRTLGRVRIELAALREEMGPALARLGPKTARLERLDAALFSATATGRVEVQDRLMSALGRSFAQHFAAAVAALPVTPTVAHVLPWFEPGGAVRIALDGGRDTILGILEHEHRRFVALVACA